MVDENKNDQDDAGATDSGTQRSPDEDGTDAPAAEAETEAAESEAVESEEVETEATAEDATEDDPVARLEAESANLKDQLLRALAEVENTRRRGEKERSDVAKYAVSNFAKDIVAVADNLRRALDAIPPEALKNDNAVQALAEGVELTERELLGALERHGIRKLEPLGEPFDHNYHQAMFEVESPDQPAGTVVQLLQAGYLIHDRLLRPAMVGVAKSPPESGEGDAGGKPKPDGSASKVDETA